MKVIQLVDCLPVTQAEVQAATDASWTRARLADARCAGGHACPSWSPRHPRRARCPAARAGPPLLPATLAAGRDAPHPCARCSWLRRCGGPLPAGPRRPRDRGTVNRRVRAPGTAHGRMAENHRRREAAAPEDPLREHGESGHISPHLPSPAHRPGSASQPPWRDGRPVRFGHTRGIGCGYTRRPCTSSTPTQTSRKLLAVHRAPTPSTSM
jgi:hypothetical protein